MFRPLLLAILGAVLLLCLLCGAAHQPRTADLSAGNPDSSKQPQMDAAPAISTTAASLQPASLSSQPAKDLRVASDKQAAPTLPPAAQAVQHSLQASILLRI